LARVLAVLRKLFRVPERHKEATGPRNAVPAGPSWAVDLRLALAWWHLLALAIGLGGVWSRARALRAWRRGSTADDALRRAYTGDAWWGLAALLWLSTGLWRLLGGTEKATSYYVASHAFRLKMALFLVIIAIEVWPMRTLVRWRRRTSVPSPHDALRIEWISYLQCALVGAMVLAATAMARGYGIAPAPRAVPPLPASSAPPGALLPADSVRMAPSGTETVTDEDIALLTREIAMPLDSVDPSGLHSNFDERRGGGTRRHQAIDLMAARRTPIHAAAAGRVLKLFTSAAGGLMVYAADSSERWIMLYAHLDGYAPGLRDGAPLARGQLIGFVGSTGNAQASAPHLHFAIARSADVRHWSRGRAIDPLPVLRAATGTLSRAGAAR
jgi:murein DD-endopeptidase MepM/ murein hydrolase activator NlpD